MAVMGSLADKIKLQNQMKQQRQVVAPVTPVQPAPVVKPTIDPATVPTFDIGNTMRNKPTVATPTNPVISKGGSTFVPNTSDINSMDRNQLQDYIDTYSVKSKFGTIKEEDAIKAVKAQRLLNDFIKKEQTAIGSPIDAEIAKAQADREALAKKLEEQNLTARQAKEKQLTSSFEAQKAEQLAAGERQKQASQASLSTSGFGRSTFNADQQTRIQQQTDSAIQTLSAAKEAELARFDAEQAGASAEYLGALDKQISDLKTSAYTAQQKAIAEASKINQETGASMEESIQNLLATAKQTGLEINPGDEGAIKMLAQVAIKDGKINQSVLDALPDGIREIVKAAAETGYGQSIGEPGKTISIGSGRSERVLQWNPKTGRYDIPVGGGSIGGGVGGGGIGVGGGASSTGQLSSGSVYDDLISLSPGNFKNVDQANSYGFASNAILANEDIKNNQGFITGLSAGKATAYKLIPGVFEGLKPEQLKKQEQAERNFVNAVLRKESGAAISDSEMSNSRSQYFPQPGDTAEVIAQKEKNRAVKIQSLINTSGKANLLKPVAEKTYSSNSQKTTTPAPTTKVNTKSTKLEDLWNSL